MLSYLQFQVKDTPGLYINPGSILLKSRKWVNMAEKVTIFIDGANLLHGLAQDFNKIDVDFEKLVNKLLGGRDLSRVYYYTALPDQKTDPIKYAKQQGFVEALNRKPYFKVVQGRLEPRGDSYVEKGVDIALAIDMLELANTYDTAILISGDGDFAKAIEAIQRMGKHTENAITRSCLSRNLEQTCDKVIILDKEFLKTCWR